MAEATTEEQAILQAHVDYLPGLTIVGAQDALLEWSADDHIHLFQMDLETNLATEEIFDVEPRHIKRISGSVGTLIFHIKDQTYKVQFMRNALAGGLIVAYGRNKASGIDMWLRRLRKHRVNVSRYHGFPWVIAWGASIVTVFICAAVLYVLLRHANTY